jgi:hypothetical protein
MRALVSRRRMHKTILFALALGWTPIAWPADWVLLGSTSQGNLAIDAASIERRGELVQYWLRHTLPAPALDAATGQLYQRLEVHRYMNCRAQTSAIAQERVYAPDGRLISTQAEPDPSRLVYQAIKPETMGAAEMRYVCQGKAGRDHPPSGTRL